MSRTCWACAQVSGEAEPAAPPFSNPMDAVVGSVPNGEAGRSGSSQACSGTSPMPDANRCMPSSSSAAVAASPVCRCCSARSPLSTGHTWPEPLPPVGHGLPVGGQVVASGS